MASKMAQLRHEDEYSVGIGLEGVISAQKCYKDNLVVLGGYFGGFLKVWTFKNGGYKILKVGMVLRS